MHRILNISIALLLFTGLAGCEDPAEGKPAAKVEAPAKAEAPPADPAAAAATPADAIAFDQGAGKIAWVGSKVTGSHGGGFEKFTGWVKHDPASKSYTFQVTIDMSSVVSDSGKLTEHLRSGDFFLVSEHPTARFETTEPVRIAEGKTTVTGNLTLRGVTKKITFPATGDLSEDGYTFRSEFSIKRFEWGVVYPGQADDLIRDDVLIKLDFEATL